MPNTYSQMYVQLVFAVKYRQSLISSEHRVEIEKYITGMITNKGQKLLAIYAMPDHIHILINYKPDINLSELVKVIKVESTKFINENKLSHKKFKWQEGFGAFTYSIREFGRVIDYIMNQEEHHKKRSFREEYLITLMDFNVEYKDQYLFNWLDD
jgi:putative transposase